MKKTREEKEREILELFSNNGSLTSKEIKKEVEFEPYETLKNLVYFEYLAKNDDKYAKTKKEYDWEKRKNEKRDEDYTIVLNKIFTGSFLTYNLGHEIINFIKDDVGQRYVYRNPWGSRGKGEAKYAFHIIESSIDGEKGVFELVAVSKIDTKAEKIYNEKGHKKEKDESPIYKEFSFYDIFYCGKDSDKAHVYTYKASELYVPQKRVLIKINRNEATIVDTGKEIILTVMCNPQHSVAYADVTGRKTCSANKNPKTDLEVLKEIINNYLEKRTEDFDIDNMDDEQCFSVISGRARLEVSTSNQIAYFMQRDKKLTYLLLHDFLEIDDIEEKEEFEIIREKEEHIDLLFKSDKHIVVVENKIDSGINGVATEDKNKTNCKSQLSNYFEYVEKEYKNILDHRYYILAPEYSDISRDIIDKKYKHGEKYIIKTYNDLYNTVKNYEYMPLREKPSELGKALFEQFKKSIEYLTWSNAKQHERTAYIRLKQRITELKFGKIIKQ